MNKHITNIIINNHNNDNYDITTIHNNNNYE